MQNVFIMAISRSKQLLIYLIIVHSVMLLTALILFAASIACLVAILLIVSSFIYYCRYYQWLNSDTAIINIARNEYEKWTLQQKLGIEDDELILKSCVVTQKLVILNFNSGSIWRDKSLTVFSDSVDSEAFRQLRVYCREATTFQQ